MSISKSAFRSALALILTGAVTLACQREPAAPLAGTGPMVGESGGTAQAPVGETADPQQFSALLAKGDALLPRGSLLRAQDIGSLLSLGITKVSVFEKVKVALG